MNAGEVDVLLILGCNPAFDAPTDLQFMTAMNSVSHRVHLGLYEDETAEFCHWHLPQAHFLESWGDARAYDGSVCLTQPLIEPLYDGRTAAEILSIFAEDQPKTGLEILQEYWRRARPEDNFDKTWRQWLHDGFITDSQAASVPVTVVANAIADACSQIDVTAPMPETLEIVFRPDPTLYDGRYCNNGWLQECPKPLSKLTWDNALLIAPTTAKALGVSNSQKVEITIAGRPSRCRPGSCPVIPRGPLRPIWVTAAGEPVKSALVPASIPICCAGPTLCGRPGQPRCVRARGASTSSAHSSTATSIWRPERPRSATWCASAPCTNSRRNPNSPSTWPIRQRMTFRCSPCGSTRGMPGD